MLCLRNKNNYTAYLLGVKKVILNELFNEESIKPGSQLSNWCLTCLTKFYIVTYVKQNNVLLCEFITLKVNSGYRNLSRQLLGAPS